MIFRKYVTEKLLKETTKKRILFIDGQDSRAQEAAQQHLKDNIIEPILLFEKKSEKANWKHGAAIAIEDWQDQKETLIETYLARRKGKDSLEIAQKNINDKNVFAMLMLEMNEVDGVIGGLVAPTADILRAAFKVIGPKPGIKTISSIMVMTKESDWYVFGDISVNIEPNAAQLVDIASNAATFAETLDIDPRIAFLSFSTSGSAEHPKSLLVKEATDQFNKQHKLAHQAIGEVQFDAAFDLDVLKSKYKSKTTFDKPANIFIFPDLNAGNIGYKIAQRMGQFGAIGPIITGVNKPVNDLSRGAKVADVYNTALLTAIQSI